MVKIVRGSRSLHQLDDIKRPQCPNHQKEMAYEPSIGKWKCPEIGCRFTATKRDADTKGEHKPLPKDVTPLVIKSGANGGPGTTTLRIWHDDALDEQRYAAVTVQPDGSEIAFDMTPFVETVIDDQTNSVSLILLFNNVKRG